MIQKKISAKLNKYPLIKGIFSFACHPLLKCANYRKLKQYSEKISVLPEFKNTDYSMWRESFNTLISLSNEVRFIDMIEEFYKESLTLLKYNSFKDDDIIVVCLLKNEIYRVREFVKHYRSLGADGFVFIDNGSDDGTVEFLMEQSDIALFKTRTTYNSIRKTAWINKAISYFGLNRWYIIPDSDEFFVYPEMDEMNLHEYLSALKQKGIYGVKTMMLEMYPNAPFFDDKADPSLFRYTYRFYDKDALFLTRVFGDDCSDVRPKPTVLFYDGSRFAVGSHDYFPFAENQSSDYGGIVLHYKFLPHERHKIDKIVESGVYANHSALYKLYKNRFDNDSEYNAFYEGSLEWRGTESISDFDFIKRLTSLNEK